MKKALELLSHGCVKVASIVSLPIFTLIAGRLLSKTIVFNDISILLSGLIVDILFVFLIFSFLVFLLSRVDTLTQPMTFPKTLKYITALICLGSFIFGTVDSYKTSKEEQLQQTKDAQARKAAQDAWNNLSPEKKAEIQERNRKIEADRIENEKISKMPPGKREAYLKEKEMFSKMTSSEIDAYKAKQLQEKKDAEELDKIKRENFAKQLDIAGSFIQMIKQSLKVEESLKIKSVAMYEDNYYCVVYKAKNAFGVDLKSMAILTPNAQALVEDSPKFERTWNQYCTRPYQNYATSVGIKFGYLVDR